MIMKNIKLFVKKNGIKLSELADWIEVSRPTLDAYIRQYETTGQVEKEIYNSIFTYLFSDESISNEEFQKRICVLKNDTCMRFKPVKGLEETTPSYVDQIYNALLEDARTEEYDSKVYACILYLIQHYRHNELLSKSARYIADLFYDNLGDVDENDKAYYSYFYKVMSTVEGTSPKFDKDSYISYLKEKKKIQSEKDSLRKKTQELAKLKMDRFIIQAQNNLERSGMNYDVKSVLDMAFKMSVSDQRKDGEMESIIDRYLKENDYDSEKAAKSYLLLEMKKDEYYEMKNGDDYPLYFCPDCGQRSFVKTQNSYVCFACHAICTEDSIGFCLECGEPYRRRKDDWCMCPSCKEYKITKIEKE